MVLKRLRLRNFKGFADQAVRLARVTLLAGTNGSGKSSVLQSLLLLKQLRVEQAASKFTLDLNGSLVSLGHGEDVLHEYASNDEFSIDVTLADDSVLSVVGTYGAQAEDVAVSVSVSAKGRSPSDILRQLLLRYLCAERVGPRVASGIAHGALETGQLGIHGEFAVHYLAEHEDHSVTNRTALHPSATGNTLLSHTEAWLDEIAPGCKLDVGLLRQADVATAAFAFQRSGDVPSRYYRPTNVGFGLSFILPIIVTLLAAEPNQLTLIENPEAHLHPRGQSAIARLIAQASRGSQIIVESHSEHVMNSLRLAVKEEKLESPDVAMYFFDRREGVCSAVEPTVRPDGRLSEWPSGFFDEHEITLAALVAPSNKKT